MTMIDTVHQAYQAAKSGTPVMVPGLIEPQEPYHRFLYHIARLTKPKVMIELGVKHGNGMMHMIMGRPQAQMIGVDIQLLAVPAGVRQARNAIIMQEDSIEFLKRYEGRIDLIHLDTEHTPAQVGQELALAVPNLGEGGVICIDDIFISKAMRRWWNKLDLGIKLELDLHVTGFGVIVNV